MNLAVRLDPDVPSPPETAKRVPPIDPSRDAPFGRATDPRRRDSATGPTPAIELDGGRQAGLLSEKDASKGRWSGQMVRILNSDRTAAS